jgi:hypothetical protein
MGFGFAKLPAATGDQVFLRIVSEDVAPLELGFFALIFYKDVGPTAL